LTEIRQTDFAAVGRVARRVELREIRLADLSAKLMVEGANPLTASVNLDHDCQHELLNETLLLRCNYKISLSEGEKPVAAVSATYRILYAVSGTAPIPEADLGHFAFANGIYHSWPFLRELMFDVTAKLGFTPYTLPTFLFNPQVKPAAPKPSEEAASTEPKDSSA
jgi:preprotein translocase subunit SecB